MIIDMFMILLQPGGSEDLRRFFRAVMIVPTPP